MTILISIVSFLVVIAVLILAHELGHFITAKASGVRVDEFGLGSGRGRQTQQYSQRQRQPHDYTPHQILLVITTWEQDPGTWFIIAQVRALEKSKPL